MDPHIFQLFYCLRAFFLDDVRNGDDADEFPVSAEEKGRLSLIGEALCGFLRLIGYLCTLLPDELQIAAADSRS